MFAYLDRDCSSDSVTITGKHKEKPHVICRSFENNWNTYKLLAHINPPDVKVSLLLFFILHQTLIC